MRIAFISFEYPIDTPLGGIATYTYQAAHLLSRRGHQVEVFSASPVRNAVVDDGGVKVHLIQETSQGDFAVLAGHSFASRHSVAPFDVLEAPELYMPGRKAIELVPAMPFVVRMHTPNLQLWKNSLQRRSWREVVVDIWWQLYSLPGYIRRRYRIPDFRFVHPDLGFAQHQDVGENNCARAADQVVAMFPGMRTFLEDTWHIPSEQITVMPNPFTPSPSLLRLSPGTMRKTVSIIGRLDVLKGILDLMSAIPIVLQSHPETTFRFVGAPGRVAGEDSISYLKRHLAKFTNRLQFTGALPQSAMPDAYALTGIVIVPSRWENYPYACLEAMAAGRAVIGSSVGGMAVLLADGAGILVRPQRPLELAQAICELLSDPDRQRELGDVARRKVLQIHQEDLLGSQMEECYAKAIELRRKSGPRA